jgi:hypothetical protein
MLVDDGVPKRSHRNNLLKSENKCCAVATGFHAQTKTCSVILFAAQVVDKKGSKSNPVGDIV